MKISFICNPIYINGGWSPFDTRIGGSEECIVEWSKRLAERGYECRVFHNGKHGTYEGVEYRNHSEFEPGDVTINVNYPQFKSEGKTIFWTSLTEHPDLSHFDKVLAISHYQLANCGIVHSNVELLPPGYDHAEIYPSRKIPKQCFYASSPDRGLSTLLEIWPKVYEAHPDATLLVTYGGHVDQQGVINFGSVDEETMNQIYRTSQIWCHPCNGGELYCMTGIKAQASGCWPVIIPTMALAETVKFGTFSNKDRYAEDLISALSTSNEIPVNSYPTWDSTTDQLLDIIKSVANSERNPAL